MALPPLQDRPPLDFEIHTETPDFDADIEALNADVFGPGRFTRAAYRVREGAPADPRFCFVALGGGRLIGSVRLTYIGIGSARAFMLGPLCVLRSLHGQGVGKALVRHSVAAVMESVSLPVILVGDPPYYKPLGFENAPAGILMPGPVDYSRLLIAWPGVSPWPSIHGEIDRASYRGLVEGLAPLAVPHGGEGAEQQGETQKPRE